VLWKERRGGKGEAGGQERRTGEEAKWKAHIAAAGGAPSIRGGPGASVTSGFTIFFIAPK